MREGFDREFYRSRWQRVLPLGPDGIQPYVRARRGPGSAGAPSALRRLGAMFAGLTPSVIAPWRRGANAVATREGVADAGNATPQAPEPDRDCRGAFPPGSTYEDITGE